MGEAIFTQILDSLKEYFGRSIQWLLIVAVPFAFLAAVLRAMGYTSMLTPAGIALAASVGFLVGLLMGYAKILEVETPVEFAVKLVSFMLFLAFVGSIVVFMAQGGLPAAMGEYIAPEFIKNALILMALAFINILTSVPLWVYALMLHLGIFVGTKYTS